MEINDEEKQKEETNSPSQLNQQKEIPDEEPSEPNALFLWSFLKYLN